MTRHTYFILVLIYFPIVQVTSSHFILHFFFYFSFIQVLFASVNVRINVCAFIVFHRRVFAGVHHLHILLCFNFLINWLIF